MSAFQLPLVTLINDRPSTTSLAIAEYFEKRHDAVLRDIRNLISECPDDFNAHNFVEVDYTDAKGEKRPMYHVFFDGFILLVMGYTGPKALRMKLAYIEAFNAMQAKLEAGKSFHPDAALNKSQQDTLRAILRNRIEKDETGNHGKRMSLYQRAWKSFCEHFQIARFHDLPQGKMEEAVNFLMKLEMPEKKIEAAPQSKKIERPEEEEVIID